MKNIIRYNPDSVLSAIDDWDALMGDFFGRRSDGSWGRHPAVDIREESEGYIVEAELPGLSEKDVEIKIKDNTLVLESIKQEKEQEKKDGWMVRERRTSMFRRAFSLPSNVDTEGVKANFKDGLLTITLPKSAKAKEKSIAITRE